MKRMYFDRENIGASDVDVGFFTKTQATHTYKKSGTNMVLEAKIPNRFAVDHVGVSFTPNVDIIVADNTDNSLTADWKELLDGAFIEIEVQNGADIVMPVSQCLMSGAIHLETAARGERVSASLPVLTDCLRDDAQPKGAECEFNIPKDTMFTVKLGLVSTLSAAMANAKIVLFGEEDVTV